MASDDAATGPAAETGSPVGRLQALEDEVRALRHACREARRADEAKSLFLATMSHEIREPMNAVLGMTRLLLETPLGEDQRELVETVEDAGDALLTIINDILDLSSMEAGGLTLEQLEFDLRTLLERVVAMVEPRARDKGLGLMLDVAPELPTLLRGDPGRLRQVVSNLLGNAIKFTEEGGIDLRVSVLGRDGDRIQVGLAVSDSGVGIPAHLQAGLFSPYAQADPSIPRLYGGNGLGLTICHRLVELMGGTIDLTSRLGQGTTFDLTLPLVEVSEAAAQTTGRPGAATVAGTRILIVDPNPTTRAMLEQQTLGWGIEPWAVETGAAALTALRAAAAEQRGFHFALIDRSLVDVEGEELGRQIKADPDLRSTRMVMMASSGLRGDAARVGEIGFAAYLPKPLKASMLLSCLLQLQGAGRGRAGGAPIGGLVTAHSLSERERPGLKILLADDNAMNCRLAALILEKAGHRIDVVHDGQTAIEAVSAATYDLVLMDVQMPGIDGLEATRRIRALPIGRATVPVIAITANALQGDDRRCLDAGMDDYLTKPIDRARLLGKVIEWGYRATG